MSSSSEAISEWPKAIKVHVDFYDTTEKAYLDGNSAAKPVCDSIPTTISIPTPDLLAYYLFYKLGQSNGYGSYQEIVDRKLGKATAELDGQILATPDTIVVNPGLADGLPSPTSERLGEAIGLGVISALHKCNGADWTRIPIVNKHKTLDFQLTASDSKSILAIETKGSHNDDPSTKGNSIYDHALKIRGKKADPKSKPANCSVAYGTIGVVGGVNSTPKCWILDPPIDSDIDPRRYRLLCRFRWMLDTVYAVSPRSQLVIAGRNRMAYLEIADMDAIKPLLQASGEALAFGKYGPEPTWTAGKSHPTSGNAVGAVTPIDANRVFFYGYRDALVQTLTSTDPDPILKFELHPSSTLTTVKCVVPTARFKRDFALSRNWNLSQTPSHVSFPGHGRLYTTSSGLVFGFVSAN